MNSMFGGSGFRGQGAAPTRAGGSNNATGMLKNKIPKGYNFGRLQNFTPEQMNLFEDTFSRVGPDSYLSRLAGGDQDLFNEIESPALQQFSGELGGIASRFSQGGGGPGALSSRRSSGFQNATTSAASNFAQQLQANRQTLQRQAIQDLRGLTSDLLEQRPYQNILAPKPQKMQQGQGTSSAENWGKILGLIPGLISSVSGGGSISDAFKGAFSIFGDIPTGGISR